MKDETPHFETLHKVYVGMVGIPIAFTMHKIYAWEAWAERGFTRADLETVIVFIKRRIKQDRRRPESLLFRNLIERTESFGDDLAEAKAEASARAKQVPTQPARSAVLKATGREDEPAGRPVRSAAQVMADAEAFRAFKQYR